MEIIGEFQRSTIHGCRFRPLISLLSGANRFAQRAAAAANRIAYLRLLALLGCAAFLWWVL
jgi:hypothetical protein